MAEAVVELVNRSTSETRKARLIGVDLQELDPDTVSIVYG